MPDTTYTYTERDHELAIRYAEKREWHNVLADLDDMDPSGTFTLSEPLFQTNERAKALLAYEVQMREGRLR